MTTVRPDAPWCPSNLEFIRRINDLPDEQAVWNTVFDASYLVMGLGDVYLGAPVATPLIRAIGWSPPSTTRREPDGGKLGGHRRGVSVRLRHGRPGRLSVCRPHSADVESLSRGGRFCRQAVAAALFDQLRFYPVSADELLEIRRDFPLGRYPLRIEHSTLRLAEYQQFLAREAQSIDAFRDHQQRAFNAERDRWIASGRAHFDSQESAAEETGDAPLQPGEQGVESPVSGNLWQVQTAVGRQYAPVMCWWCLSR